MDAKRCEMNAHHEGENCKMNGRHLVSLLSRVIRAVSLNMVLWGGILYAQGVGISSVAITADPSSILELRSTGAGFLPPRMTLAQQNSIASPATGLMLYNTGSNRFDFFNGSAWNSLAASNDNLSVFSATTSAQLAGVLSDETGSGSAVFSNAPSLTTPSLGVASATSINKVTIAAPANAAMLALDDGSTLGTLGANPVTLTTTGPTNVTLPTSGTLATVREMAQLTSDVSTTSTVLGNVAGLAGYSLEANSTYFFKFRCLVTTNGTGVGILLSLNASAPVTSINYIHMYPTSAAAFAYQQVTALQGGTLPLNGPGPTIREYSLEGTIVTSSAVTVALQSRSETGANVTVKAGSFGFMKKIL